MLFCRKNSHGEDQEEKAGASAAAQGEEQEAAQKPAADDEEEKKDNDDGKLSFISFFACMLSFLLGRVDSPCLIFCYFRRGS